MPGSECLSIDCIEHGECIHTAYSGHIYFSSEGNFSLIINIWTSEIIPCECVCVFFFNRYWVYPEKIVNLFFVTQGNLTDFTMRQYDGWKHTLKVYIDYRNTFSWTKRKKLVVWKETFCVCFFVPYFFRVIFFLAYMVNIPKGIFLLILESKLNLLFQNTHVI